MNDIGFERFREKIRPLMSATKCDVKKEIDRQLTLCVGRDKKDAALDEAVKFCGAKISVSADPFDSLSRGRGSRDVAIAIYYWLHSQLERKDNAKAIDRVIFKEAFDEKYGFRVFNFSDPDQERVLPKLDKPLDHFVESERLRVVSQEYPSLILLLSQINELCERRDVSYVGKKGLFSMRSVLDQVAWLDTDIIDQLREAQVGEIDMSEWRTPYGEFERFIDNRRFVLVRSDGARIATDALHRIESWFLAIWHLTNDGVIQEKNMELFVRYLLVFAQFNRSSYLKFYFIDSKKKIDDVLRHGVKVAKKMKINMSDYKPLDDDYLDIFDLQESDAS